MESTAYEQYAEEASDWLKAGRARLLHHLVETYRPPRAALELLEIGAGVGQNLPALAAFGAVDACESSPLGQAAIAAGAVARQTFSSPVPFALERTYDVIAALDVLEHIEDDRAAASWVAEHLRPGGIFVATVPAYPWLFSDHDRALHHHRRYTRRSLRAALPESLEVLVDAYFNHLLFPLAVGSRAVWALTRSGKGGGKQRSPRAGLVASALGAVLRGEVELIRRGYRPAWGLSVYCVARRSA